MVTSCFSNVSTLPSLLIKVGIQTAKGFILYYMTVGYTCYVCIAQIICMAIHHAFLQFAISIQSWTSLFVRKR